MQISSHNVGSTHAKQFGVQLGYLRDARSWDGGSREAGARVKVRARSGAMTGAVNGVDGEARPKVVVVKIGTSTLMREADDGATTVASAAGRGLKSGEGELAVSTLALLVDTLISLRREGCQVVLVSSGAVGMGCRELGVAKRPSVRADSTQEEKAEVMAQIQAYAAVGQGVLVRTYDHLMRMANQPVAQVLLTSNDLGSECQYRNAQNTMAALLKMGVIPIVNENDTVATEELKYGDNDWLSALVSTAIGADWLFLLTDVDQLYTANPRVHPDATPIDVVPNIEALQVSTSSNATGTQWGTGGMSTKITAARLATAAGVRVCLLHGRHPSRLLDFVHGREGRLGTVFEPLSSPLIRERTRWISHCLPPRGEVRVGEAHMAPLVRNRSLCTMGVTSVKGDFGPNSAVTVCDPTGAEVARGLCNFSSDDLTRFAGMGSDDISAVLGVPTSSTVVHRDNLAILVDDIHERKGFTMVNTLP